MLHIKNKKNQKIIFYSAVHSGYIKSSIFLLRGESKQTSYLRMLKNPTIKDKNNGKHGN